ncbi:hypothetical protein BSBH6_02108 [Bacillus subtilis]|nr:hypothetical protein BSBH6_02108 [Bacillus subtilis]RPK25170.1 hypothetical protein BH5_02001 [Bacillus subtilis]
MVTIGEILNIYFKNRFGERKKESEKMVHLFISIVNKPDK